MVKDPFRKLLVEIGIRHVVAKCRILLAKRLPLHVPELLDQLEQVVDQFVNGFQFAEDSEVTERKRSGETTFLIGKNVIVPTGDIEQLADRQFGIVPVSRSLDLDILPVNALPGKRFQRIPDRIYGRENGGNQVVELLILFEVGQVVAQPLEDMFDELLQRGFLVIFVRNEIIPHIVHRLEFIQLIGSRGEIRRHVSEEILEERVFGHGKEGAQFEEKLVQNGGGRIG